MKDVVWIGSSRDDLKEFPAEVQHEIGFALYRAQEGAKHPNAKPLQGFGGAGVLQVIEDFDGDTYRAVYTVKLASAIYVLHVFQKKSKKKRGNHRARHCLDSAALAMGPRTGGPTKGVRPCSPMRLNLQEAAGTSSPISIFPSPKNSSQRRA